MWVNIDDPENARSVRRPRRSQRAQCLDALGQTTRTRASTFRRDRRVRAAGRAFPHGGTSGHCTYYTAPATDGLPKEPQTGLCAIVPQSASARGTRHIFPATRTHAHILQPPLPAVVVVARFTARELSDPS